MLNLNSLMIGTENPKRLADFYSKVLGKKPDMEDGEWYGFNAGGCFLSIGFHDKVKGSAKNPERLILNFETKEVEKEFARIKKLGAKVFKEPYSLEGFQVATFIDPDGNYFQLMTPWE